MNARQEIDMLWLTVRRCFVLNLLFVLGSALVQSTSAQQPIRPNAALGVAVRAPSMPSAKAGTAIVRGRYSSESLRMIQAVAEKFPARDKLDVAFDDHASFGRFCDHDAPFHIVICEGDLTPHQKRCLEQRFPMGTPQPEAFLVGQLRVVFVANKSNPIESLDYTGIRKAISSAVKASKWHCYGPAENTWARQLIQNKCMIRWRDANQPGVCELQKLDFRDDIVACADAKEVIAKVRGNQNALGFFVWDGQLTKHALQGLKVLPIAVKEGGQAVAPPLDIASEQAYPLAGPLVLYVHPSVPAVAREFCKFATGPEAAKIVQQFGIWPEYLAEQAHIQQRLAQVRAGEGTKIITCDLIGGEKMLKDLSLEFVKAKAAVQLKFTGGEGRGMRDGKSTDDAFEKLSKGAIELLLADGGITEGGKGKAEGGKDSGQSGAESHAPRPSPLAPASIELGRLAVGVVVHPDNPLRLLPTSEVRDIFCGKIKQWPAVHGVAATMHVYGLQPRDPASQLFKEKLTEPSYPSSPAARLTLKYSARADSAAVILTVAHDPAAIGFVNLNQLPENEKSVKLVPVGEGPEVNGQGSAANHSVFNPLEQIFTLYVSPNAGQAAKDFAAYLTPEHCRELIAQNNLLPPLRPENALADEHHPLPKGNGTELASADKPEPLLDDSEVSKNQKVKSPRQIVKDEDSKDSDLETGNEDGADFRNKDSRAVTSKPELAKSRRPLLHNSEAPEPESTPKHPKISALSSEQAVLLAGGVISVVLLAVGIGWLRAPHRKKVRR